MSKLRAKLDEARKNTKIAFVGGALVVAGAWGSCQLQLSEEGSEAPEAAAEPQEEEAPPQEPEAEPEAEEALPEETD